MRIQNALSPIAGGAVAKGAVVTHDGTEVETFGIGDVPVGVSAGTYKEGQTVEIVTEGPVAVKIGSTPPGGYNVGMFAFVKADSALVFASSSPLSDGAGGYLLGQILSKGKEGNEARVDLNIVPIPAAE